jgi:hypothetical protein
MENLQIMTVNIASGKRSVLSPALFLDVVHMHVASSSGALRVLYFDPGPDRSDRIYGPNQRFKVGEIRVARVVVEGSVFEDNVALGSGGGVALGDLSPLVEVSVEGSAISRNKAAIVSVAPFR